MLHIADGVLYLIQLLGTKTTYLKARDLSGSTATTSSLRSSTFRCPTMWNGSPRFQGIECKVVHENMWKQECAQHEHVDEFCVSGVNPKPPTEDDRCFWQGEGHRCRDIETEPDLPEAIWTRRLRHVSSTRGYARSFQTRVESSVQTHSVRGRNPSLCCLAGVLWKHIVCTVLCARLP